MTKINIYCTVKQKQNAQDDHFGLFPPIPQQPNKCSVIFEIK